MTFVLIIVVLALVITGVSMTVRRGGAITGPPLSIVAREIVKEYNALPVDQRPVPDIRSVVAAIDETHAHNTLLRDRHFDDNWSEVLEGSMLKGGYTFTWKKKSGWAPCPHTSCEFKDYGSLHRAIQDVHTSIKEKEKALALSMNAGSLDLAKEIEAQLRSEANLNKTFVREFKELT